MKLLADENVDSTIVTALRKAGHDVRYVVADLDRPAVRHPDAMPIGQGDFALFQFLQIELDCQVFRQTEMDGAGVDQGVGGDRAQVAIGRIGKFKGGSKVRMMPMSVPYWSWLAWGHWW
ncbi:DUF5615 family PIN-like protein [Lamprobacter sp.]|uniref:DUF5615 family PIN-like protein n=1 Tax=Lamprobacter sp. TaxID=3100796 RepID=UPI003A4DE670